MYMYMYSYTRQAITLLYLLTEQPTTSSLFPAAHSPPPSPRPRTNRRRTVTLPAASPTASRHMAPFLKAPMLATGTMTESPGVLHPKAGGQVPGKTTLTSTKSVGRAPPRCAGTRLVVMK